MRRFLVAVALLFAFCQTAQAAEPYFDFSNRAGQVPSSFNPWHNTPEMEKNGDYGETWFALAQTENGGVLFAMISITNLGLGTYDGRIDAQYYPPNGAPVRFYKELKRDDVSGASTTMDVHVGSAHYWGNTSTQHFTIDDPKFKLNLTLTNELPSLIFGDGVVRFYADKSSMWSCGINSPRSKTTGTLNAGGQSFKLEGKGYADHGFSTIKIPTMMKKWFSLRAFDAKYTVILHHQYLSEKFGSKWHKFGVFGVDGKNYPMRDFTFKPTANRKDAKSGYSLPTAFDVEFKAGDYTVKGTVKESKFLDGIDVLSQVNWLVRGAIKAFYSNPYVFRYLDQYELDVTGPDGKAEHISGQGVVESNFF